MPTSREGTTDARLVELRASAEGCTACPLYERATQVVFGEGAADADVALVGEQPGDREDLEGRPFVGPAGRVLDDALGQAHIARELVYLTNAVKHFKWEPRGKRRIHKSPNQTEIVACGTWLAAELEVVSPRLVVALGAVAARALTGPSTRVTRDRGTIVPGSGVPVLITVHPAAVLRSRRRDEDFAALVRDLEVVPAFLDG